MVRALDVRMEELPDLFMVRRPAFDNYKSNVCHRLKEMGDIDALILAASGMKEAINIVGDKFDLPNGWLNPSNADEIISRLRKKNK